MATVESLTAGDLAMFARFRIDQTLLSQAGVQRVDGAEAARLLGRPVSADLSGLLFPYRDPKTERPNSSCAVRLDNPPVGSDGKPKGKYLFPPGRSHVYFPPDAAARVGDATVPLVIVESQKAALALEGVFRRAGRTALPVGINGCWGWNGVIGKTENANGARVDEKGMLPDLGALCLAGREVIILLDANVAENPLVAAAERRLAGVLAGRGMTVRFGRIPQEAGVNGPDDYLAAHDDNAVIARLDQARENGMNPGKREGGSAATTLLHLVADGGGRLFHSPEGRPYLTFHWNGHDHTVNLETEAGKQFLTGVFWRAQRRGLATSALTEAVNTLSAQARFEGPERPVFVRVAHFEGKVILDLGRADHNVIVMTPDGWIETTTADVVFERPRDSRPLPSPTRGGTLDGFMGLLPIPADGIIAALIKAWLVYALGGIGPFAILHISGEQGGGKSMLARLCKRLIDDEDEPLRSGSSIRDAESVGVAARNSHVLAIDNVSFIQAWLSDVLCAVSTGGAVGGRELYTNSTERRLKLKGPSIITSINKVVNKPDLLDRTISIEWPLMTDDKRRDERELNRDFEAVRPAALGALCSAVCSALRDQGSVQLKDRPRLADFVTFATAAEPALGLAKHAVYAAVCEARDAANQEELEGSVMALALLKLCSDGWSGTVKALLAEVESLVPDHPRPGQGWPRSPKGMGNELRQLAPLLRRAGCSIVHAGHKEAGEVYTLGKACSASSGATEPEAIKTDGGDTSAEHAELGGHGSTASTVRVERDGERLRFSRPPV